MDLAQAGHSVRFEWGATGGAAIARGVDVAVVVDVLTFGTLIGLVTDRGSTAVPLLPGDVSGAPTFVATSTTDLGAIELPARVGIEAGDGGRVSTVLAEVATTVAVAGLRNAAAVAAWLAREHDAETATIAVVAAGSTWSDGSLRPAIEDLWGAGAVLAALEDFDWPGLSPEAAQAADAYRLIAGREASHLAAIDAGRGLSDDDLHVAAQADPAASVPLLSDRGFVAAP